jgi:urate oxidase
MTIVLGPNQYGKAENRVVRIYRDSARHEIRDLNVSTALRGDFSAAHLTGDQSRVLPTDTQKQTVYAYAKEKGIGEIEDFALELGRHFVGDTEPVEGARIEVEEYAWQRISVDGVEHDHSWVRSGQEVRTTVVTIDGKTPDGKTPDGKTPDGRGGTETVVSGLKDLVVLKSTGSEFHGFLEDAYTTLVPTHDRIMATSLVARWRYVGAGIDWGATYASIRQILVEQFAVVHSLALQQTLYAMGRAVLEAHADVAEIKFSAPNRHHFVYDLAPFGLDNPNEVFHADDRPYGLIEATVLRDDAPPAGRAWDTVPGFC